MNSAVVSAVAALTGSALGAISPITTNYLAQRSQTQRELFSHELTLRQSLYGEFIQTAAKLYADASTTSLDKLDDVVGLYSLIARMRLVASDPVIGSAEELVRVIIARYGESNLTLEDFRNAAVATRTDPLLDFSRRCREELRTLLRHPF